VVCLTSHLCSDPLPNHVHILYFKCQCLCVCGGNFSNVTDLRHIHKNKAHFLSSSYPLLHALQWNKYIFLPLLQNFNFLMYSFIHDQRWWWHRYWRHWQWANELSTTTGRQMFHWHIHKPGLSSWSHSTSRLWKAWCEGLMQVKILVTLLRFLRSSLPVMPHWHDGYPNSLFTVHKT